MLSLMIKSLFSKTSSSECESVTFTDTEKQKVLIIGAGIMGLTSAYFLSKKNSNLDITLIDKNYPVKGASEQNACTITLIPYPSFTEIDIWSVLKENIFGYENKLCLFKFSLLFESHFRFWLRKYMLSRSQKAIDQSNRAIIKMGTYGLSLWDDLVSEICSSPTEVDYTHGLLVNMQRGIDEKTVQEKHKMYDFIKQFDPV